MFRKGLIAAGGNNFSVSSYFIDSYRNIAQDYDKISLLTTILSVGIA